MAGVKKIAKSAAEYEVDKIDLFNPASAKNNGDANDDDGCCDEHKSLVIMEDESVNLLQKFTVQCFNLLSARMQDIITVRWEYKQCWITDIMVPREVRVKEAAEEGEETYQDLNRKIARLYEFQNVFVSIAVGVLGTLTGK